MIGLGHKCGHDRLSPCGQGVLRPSTVGGRCLAWSHEHHGPGGVRGRRPRPQPACSKPPPRAEQSRTTSARSASSSSPRTGPTSTPPPPTPGSRRSAGAALLADESLGGDGTPAVAAFTPEPFALALGMSPSAGAQLIADALDLRHRLPMLWKRRVPVGGAGLAGPPGRPPDPPPVQGRRDLGRRTARRPRHLRPRRSSTGSSPTPSPSTTPRNTKTARTTPTPAGTSR